MWHLASGEDRAAEVARFSRLTEEQKASDTFVPQLNAVVTKRTLKLYTWGDKKMKFWVTGEGATPAEAMILIISTLQKKTHFISTQGVEPDWHYKKEDFLVRLQEFMVDHEPLMERVPARYVAMYMYGDGKEQNWVEADS